MLCVWQVQSQCAELKQKYDEMRHKIQDAKDYSTKLNQEMAALGDIEDGVNKEVLQKLRDLVAINESLKKQEQEFR